MIITVDSLPLLSRYVNTGVHSYSAHVLKECLKIAEASEPDLEFHAFVTSRDYWAVNGFASPRLRIHESRALNFRRYWRLGGMAFSSSLIRPDVVFLPSGQSSIPYPFAPVVVTIHDAMPMRLPPEFLVGRRRSHFLTWASAKVADKVITVSSWSKKDLVEIYGLPPEKVAVTYLGFDRRYYNSTAPDPDSSGALLNRFGIRKPFIFHHGIVQLRKNVQGLIQAWDRLHRHCKQFDAQLVLAGALGHGHEEILRVRQASPKRDQIILTGSLPDAELAILIKNASLCVIPSFYEGFCLPMVEAMACGVPTVASRSSCIPEVSGSVLEYFDPYSIEEMAATIQRALEDSDLRSRLRERGLARSAEFSWETCAQETFAILKETYDRYA